MSGFWWKVAVHYSGAKHGMRSVPIRTPFIPLAALGGAILLVGCQSLGERVMARAQREDTCGAKPLRVFIGRKADQATRNAIERRVPNQRGVRWISPGEDIIADLNTGRINVALDNNGMIMGVGCY